jgi:hypothetical protein
MYNGVPLRSYKPLAYIIRTQNIQIVVHTVPPEGARGGAVVEALSYKPEGRGIPLQALIGCDGSRRLRFPEFRTIGT